MSAVTLRKVGESIPDFDLGKCWNCQAAPNGGCSRHCALCTGCCRAANARHPQPARVKS